MRELDCERPSIPRITVCLPTYNRARYLVQCLGSILAQTFRDFEVIVSDNCSTDATPEVVGTFNDPRIRYVRNARNIGVFPNMNQCLDLARGEYVCILHDDDLYAPRFLEREAGMLDTHPTVGFVHCAAYEIDTEGRRSRVAWAYDVDCVRGGKQEFLRYLGGHNVCCSTVMARRDLYRATGGFDSSYLCSDFLMWLRLSLAADVAYIAEPLAAMRVHDSTLSSNVRPARWCSEYLAILDRGLEMASAVCPSLIPSKDVAVRRAVRVQGKRFLIAAAAASAAGAFDTADEFIRALQDLEVRGLPRVYVRCARAFRNRRIARVLCLVRDLRRRKAARQLGDEAAWCRPRGAPVPRDPLRVR